MPTKKTLKITKAPSKGIKAPAKAKPSKAKQAPAQAGSGTLDLMSPPQDAAPKARAPKSAFSYGDRVRILWAKAYRNPKAKGMEAWEGIVIPPSHTHVLEQPDGTFAPSYVVPAGHCRIYFGQDPDGALCAPHWADVPEHEITLISSVQMERARVREANKASRTLPLPEAKEAEKARENLSRVKQPLPKGRSKRAEEKATKATKAPSKATKAPSKAPSKAKRKRAA